MTRRVAVVTGASSGIGKEAARMLAADRWKVIALGRDPDRSAAALKDIGGDATMLVADLSLLAEAERVADEIAGLTDRIDVLINNAGGVADARRITAEGHEATFAGNHLGPFLLTRRLLPLLRAAAADSPPGATRIIATSSSGHLTAPGFDWDDIEILDGPFQPAMAYCNAKLANILFARSLARRLGGDGIVSHAMHPGIVDSNFTSHGDANMKAYMATRDLRPPHEAGEMLYWLATAEEPGRSTGGYFHGHEEVASSEASQDETMAERLWEVSEGLVQAHP